MTHSRELSLGRWILLLLVFCWVNPALASRYTASRSIPLHELLSTSMKTLGLKQADLKVLPLGSPEKVALPWWLHKHTTVSLRWVADRLIMGHYTRGSVGNRPNVMLCRHLERQSQHAGKQ